MPYLIDGHNLIPHIGGLRLESPDDEQHLIRLLQAFASTRRQKIEVYFDRAAVGKAGHQSFGQVTAHFVVREMTADAAISARLNNWENRQPVGRWSVPTARFRLLPGAGERRFFPVMNLPAS
jgi:hypothetical protein